MFFKILLPALVGFLVYFLGKSHARREQHRHFHNVSAPAAKPGIQAKLHNSFRLVATVLAISTLFIAGMFIYEDWQYSHQEMTIRVINAQTGESVTYQALQGEVHGRLFTTIDGRIVRLAGVERMEVEKTAEQ